MSGPDVIALIGLAAAVSQLIGYGNQLRWWMQDARNASANINKFHAEAQAVHSLANSVGTIPFRDQHDQHLRYFVQSCIDESEKLMRLAEDWSPEIRSSPPSLLRKLIWASIWKRKVEQIKQCLDNIERHKLGAVMCCLLPTATSEGAKLAGIMEEVSSIATARQISFLSSLGLRRVIPKSCQEINHADC